MLQSGEEPPWPLKVGLRELPLALSAAHDFGKVGLVVANGLEEVERYLLYSCEGLIDGKQLIGEVFIKKNQSLEEAKEMLRDLLLSSMETHGVGVSLHIRMGDSACDLQRFCADSMFPAQVFGGPQRWSNEEVLRHFPHSGISLQKDFQLVISTRFNLEDCRLHLADKIPSWKRRKLEDCIGVFASWRSTFVLRLPLRICPAICHTFFRDAIPSQTLNQDKLKRLIPISDRLRQKEGGDSSFWKRVMRSVRHSMTARRGSSAMKADTVQRATSGLKNNLGNLDRLHSELVLIWQALPPKPPKMAAGTLLLRPMAPQVLQEAVRNFYLKSCGRHRQVEQAVCNLCRMVLQFGNNPKVLLFAIMCDIVTFGELEGKTPKVVNDVKLYLESPKLEYVSNLPFDAVHTMSEFMTAIKNVKRSKQFAGGKAAEIEDSLLPVPLLFIAASVICSRSKLTAQYFNLMMLSYARQPILLSPEETQELDKLLAVPRNSGSTERKSDSEAAVASPTPEIQRSETNSFVDSLWEAIMKTARKKSRLSTFSIQLDQREIAESHMAAQVTTERFRLQVPEALVEAALLAMQPELAPLLHVVSQWQRHMICVCVRTDTGDMVTQVTCHPLSMLKHISAVSVATVTSWVQVEAQRIAHCEALRARPKSSPSA
eukprot:s709_g7.t1